MKKRVSTNKDIHKDIDSIKFGEHLIFDAYGCNPEKLGDMTTCYETLNSIAIWRA